MQRAKTIELHSREIKPLDNGKRKNVYTNGSDDNYPERVELIINNSVTAKMAVNKMVSFVAGNGFVDKGLNSKILNKTKGLTGYDILMLIANSLVKQKGVYIHANFNGLMDANYLDVLPYKYCRKQKSDDLNNNGKIFYSDEWSKSTFSFSQKNKDSKWFYPFTSNKKVLIAQFKKEGVTIDTTKDSHNFRGQVSFLNLEPENIYPLSFIDPAYNDADSEYHSSIHRNNTIRNGFTDKQIIIAKEGSKEEPNQVEDVIVDMMGSDGSNVGLIEVSSSAEDIAKELHVISLGSNIKAERYKYFDTINQTKILQCYENIPESLVLGSDGGLIGDGGVKMKELKLNYSQDVAYIRMSIQQQLKKILPNENWEIEPLVTEEKKEVENV